MFRVDEQLIFFIFPDILIMSPCYGLHFLGVLRKIDEEYVDVIVIIDRFGSSIPKFLTIVRRHLSIIPSDCQTISTPLEHDKSTQL